MTKSVYKTVPMCASFQVSLDFRKLGIHPSQLMFRIEGQPVHGQLRLDLGPDPDGSLGKGQERTITTGADEVSRTFSMLDLWHGRVMYVHSGSEVQQDFFMFSVFSTDKKKELPLFLKGNRLHRFDITISPVNDAPVLSLPEGNLFTLVEKSQRKVGAAGYPDFVYIMYKIKINMTMSPADNRCAKSVRS